MRILPRKDDLTPLQVITGNRERIVTHLQKGLDYPERMRRELNMATGSMLYNLRLLEEKGVIESQKYNGKRWYRLRDERLVSGDKNTDDVLIYLVEAYGVYNRNKGIGINDITRFVPMRHNILSRHMRHLVAEGRIIRDPYNRRYYPATAQVSSPAISVQRPSALSDDGENPSTLAGS